MKLNGDTSDTEYYKKSGQKISDLRVVATHKEYERKRNGVSTPKGGK